MAGATSNAGQGGAPELDAGLADAGQVDPAPALAIDELITGCPDADVLDEIDADLELVFEFDPTAGSLACTAADGSRDLTKAEERAYQALIAMRALSFDEALPWTDKPLYEWLTDSIDGIIFNDTGGFCCTPGPDGMGTFIQIRFGTGATALVTDLWADRNGVGLVNLVDVIVHEARHSNGPAHTCPDASSDETLDEMGAWGAVYSLHRWLAYHADPCFLRPTLAADASYPGQVFDADAYQLTALGHADRTAEVRFCVTPPPMSDVDAEPLPVCMN